jgi:hypothetical protein
MNTQKVFAVSVPGANHIKVGKECQDYSLAVNSTRHFYETFTGNLPTWERSKQPLLNPKPLCGMVIVADGHGDDSCFRSAKGSQFAAESTRKCIAEFLRVVKKKPVERELKQLIKSIIKTWNEAVQNDFDMKPFGNSELDGLSEKKKTKYQAGENTREAYGTTLMAVVLCESYWFGIHIGDGRCTVLNQDGTFDQPIPWDERNFLNVVGASLCDDDAADNFRIFISDKIPIGIFLCSDGIDASYPVNDNEKYLAELYRSLAITFVDKDFDKVYEDIKESLPIISKKGSGDDMSLAGILDMESLEKIVPSMRKEIEAEKTEKLKQESQEQLPVEEVVQKVFITQSSDSPISGKIDIKV